MRRNQHIKELRTGLTTGTCAAAVAKASAYMLMNQSYINHVKVTLPAGKQVVLELVNCILSTHQAQCSVIKDAGDDPDITHGAKIIAKCKFTETSGVKITAGEGIGKVTKPGLSVEVGQPAINPVPLKMIHESLAEVVLPDVGIEVELSVPKGEELAQKTFNPRLGIVGGISILGTTGIVKPMSEEALKDSLVVELKQVAALGYKNIVFTPGNYGQSFLKEKLIVNDECTVLISNYIGFMLEQAVQYEIQKVVIIGHLGKLIKIAGGIFQTHSKVADARKEIMAAHYLDYSDDIDGFKQMMQSNTTEEAIDIVQDQSFWQYLCNEIKNRSEQHIFNQLMVEVVLLSQKAGLLATTVKAIQILEEISNE